jgi:hypothetical protein
MGDLDELFERLQRSPFRRRFHLTVLKHWLFEEQGS